MLLALCLSAATMASAATVPAPAGLTKTAASQVTVVTLNGKVDYMGLKGKTWKSVRLGPLNVGSRVRTGATGRLRFLTPDGADVAVGPNTEMQINALAPNAAKRTALRMFKGLLRAVFSGQHQGDLDVYNSNAVAAVKGTDLQVESAGDKDSLQVKVFSSEHQGVILSAWRGFSERLIRPGEAGDLTLAGLQVRALTAGDMASANGFGELPTIHTVPTPPASAPPARTGIERLREAVAGTVSDKKTADAIVTKALESGMSGAMLERVLSEVGKEGGTFSGLAQEQGMGSALDDVIKGVMGSPQPTPGPQPTAGTSSSTRAQLLAEAQSALDDIREDVAKNAAQDNQDKKTGALDGTAFVDRQGYRVVVAHIVQRPDPASVQIYEYSKRTEGTNAGTSIFSHAVTFNKALPEDWSTVFKRDLNDPANIVGGAPNYFRSAEFVSAASPDQVCSICIGHQYGAPTLVGGLFKQGHQDFYEVNGLPKGTATYDALNNWLSGDVITVTPSQTADKAWRMDYFNTTQNQPIFTAKVWLLDPNAVIQDPATFGVGLTHLGGFGPASSDKVYELEFSSPDLNGKDVDVMALPDTLEEALR